MYSTLEPHPSITIASRDTTMVASQKTPQTQSSYDSVKKQVATVFDTEAIKTLCEEHWNLGNRPVIPRNFVQLSETQAAKIIGWGEEEELRREHGWLKYCTPLVVNDKLVVLPKPHNPWSAHHPCYGLYRWSGSGRHAQRWKNAQ